MDKKLVALSKLISYALRHEPWIFELELDEQGWVNVENLIAALKKYDTTFYDLHRDHIQMVIEESSKRRFEMKDESIRASYGHSIPGKLLKEPAEPPHILYHGTTIEIAELIKQDAIRPMERQYVHLSVDMDTAKEVAKRKGKDITVLTINAQKAYQNGVQFYSGNDKVWLSDVIVSSYIDFNECSG